MGQVAQPDGCRVTARRFPADDYTPEPDPLPLFAPTLVPPSSGTDTSQEAAESVAPFVGSLRWTVLSAVCEAPDGLTTDELEDHLGGKHQTISPRIWELTRKIQPPLLYYSTDKRVNGSGRKARVVRPTELGLKLYREFASS